MFEDNPENKPEFNKPEPKSEFDHPEPKSEFDKPAPKSEFDRPEVKPKIKPIPKPKFKKEKQPSKIKFRFKFFFIAFILATGIYFGTGPVIEFIAKLTVGRILVGSKITIEKLSIKPTHQISFLDVRISKDQTYNALIKEANLDFTWPALFKKIAPELTLKDIKLTSGSSKIRLKELIASIKLSADTKSLSKAKPAPGKARTKASAKAKTKEKTRTKKPAFLIGKLHIKDLNFDLDIKDAKADGMLSFSLNVPDKQLDFLNLNAQYLNAGKLVLKDVDLGALQGQRGKGSVKIQEAEFAGLKVNNIRGLAVLEGMILSLDEISGRFLSKKLVSEMTLNLWPILECTANAKVGRISAAALARELGWENKIRLSGRLYAKVIFRSESISLAMLNVNFVAAAPGASLSIDYPRILKKISRQSRQPLANVREEFSNYIYKKGSLTASLLDSMLDLRIILAGPQGRKSLKFNLKNVNIFGEN